MQDVNSLIAKGPLAVIEFCASDSAFEQLELLDIKQLADVCWNHAGEWVERDRALARQWARAALAAYDLLSHSKKPLLEESAKENAAALRSWPLIHEPQPV